MPGRFLPLNGDVFSVPGNREHHQLAPFHHGATDETNLAGKVVAVGGMLEVAHLLEALVRIHQGRMLGEGMIEPVEVGPEIGDISFRCFVDVKFHRVNRLR